jgi:enamine deaminase RidA (YjgF/YER057c/UK114 family)
VGTATDRLVELGITLPPVHESTASYVSTRRVGSLVWTSGQLPFVNGSLARTGVVGHGVDQVSPAEGAELARTCAVNALAAVAAELGSLDSVKSVVKVLAFVASDRSFFDQSAVVNGFSNLLTEVLGDRGRHARSAIGVASLPMNSPIEVEVIFEAE